MQDLSMTRGVHINSRRMIMAKGQQRKNKEEKKPKKKPVPVA